MHERYVTRFIRNDLRRKMVFLGGPRQVGKTTLALALLGADERHPAYFNYDNAEDRERLFAGRWPNSSLVVLDEIHKYTRWRNWLKGIYDKSKSSRHYLVTGSARLDLYRRGGDSLFGRYHYHRLHPFSVAELASQRGEWSLQRLLECGGFPEPYLRGDVNEAKRWRRERKTLVLRQDLRDLERLLDVSQIDFLCDRLPELVGSPLSINAIAEDLQVAHRTVANWLAVLERLYYCYRVYPFGAPRIRAVKKEAKLYLWDWSELQNPGARFENMIAGHLLKYCHFVEDTQGDDMELRYLRDTDGREVDFVVLRNQRPVVAVECKLTDTAIPKGIPYFRKRTPIPRFVLVHSGEQRYQGDDAAIECIGAEAFLQELV